MFQPVGKQRWWSRKRPTISNPQTSRRGQPPTRKPGMITVPKPWQRKSANLRNQSANWKPTPRRKCARGPWDTTSTQILCLTRTSSLQGRHQQYPKGRRAKIHRRANTFSLPENGAIKSHTQLFLTAKWMLKSSNSFYFGEYREGRFQVTLAAHQYGGSKEFLLLQSWSCYCKFSTILLTDIKNYSSLSYLSK